MSDLAGFAKALAAETKELVSARLEKALGGIVETLAALSNRVNAIDARVAAIRDGEKGEKGDPGRDGRDADIPDASVIAQRAADLIPRPRDGRDVDPIALKGLIATDLAAMVREEVARVFAAMPTPKDGRDGKDADITLVKALIEESRPTVTAERVQPDITGIVRETVTAAFSSLPVARDGRDGKDADPMWIKSEIASQITALHQPKDGRDGKDVDPKIVDAMVSAHVKHAIAQLPSAKDGRDGSSVTVDDVAPLIAREVERAVKSLEPAKDGIGVKGLLINRDGHLVATLTDGSTMDAGTVVGRDGKDADPDLLLKMVTDTVAQIPAPKDGRDGADGLGIDDATLIFDEKSGFSLRLSNAVKTKDLALPLPFFAGTFRIGEKYLKGAIVNCKGVWIATADTREKPGEGATAWRLIAKNGRDGRDRGGEGNS